MSCLLAKPGSNQPNCHEYDFCYCDIEKLQSKLQKALEENTIYKAGIEAELERCGGTVPILKETLKRIKELKK